VSDACLTTAFHRAERPGGQRHRRAARKVQLAGASKSNALKFPNGFSAYDCPNGAAFEFPAIEW
jgi:hypothetical protein